jgi:hypothetical protein
MAGSEEAFNHELCAIALAGHTLQKSSAIYSIFVRILCDPAWQVLSPSGARGPLCHVASISSTQTGAEYSRPCKCFLERAYTPCITVPSVIFFAPRGTSRTISVSVSDNLAWR